MFVFTLLLVNLIFSKCEFEALEDRSVDEDDPKLFHGYLFKKITEALPDIIQKWKDFKQNLKLKFNREENIKRFFTYAKNAIFIYEFMKDNSSTFEVGENEMSHLTREEYFRRLGTFSMMRVESSEPEVEPYFETQDRQTVPKTIDWRTKNVVTPVKDQGNCGSCYSFATLSALESAMMRKNNKTVPNLSEQQVVDCGYKTGNHGCDGGILEYAFDYMKTTSIASESSYPYTQKSGRCRTVTGVSAKVKGYYQVKPGSETDLANALITKGPMAIAIDARLKSFMNYKSGIYRDPACSSDTLTHAVNLVGVMDGYYIIKNSWSTTWGIKGYVNIARNAKNMCGVASWGVVPYI